MEIREKRSDPIRRAVWIYYGFQFFFSLLLWLPIFYEYQRRIGLNDRQIFDIQGLYYIAFCLLEIPTGFLADLFGHRNCCRLGALTLVVSNLIPVFVPTYGGFLLHFVLIAISRSFVSGAASAYLYDFLKASGNPGSYKQIEGNARAYGLIGKVVCWPFIGFLMEWHFTFPYWLTAASALVSTIFAWLMPAIPAVVPAASSALDSLSRFPELGKLLFRTPILMLIMLQGTAIFVLGRIVHLNLFQPLLASRGVALSYFGVAMSVVTAFEALGSLRPNGIRRWMSDLDAVFLLTIFMSLSLALIPGAGEWGTLLLLCLFFYLSGLAFPIQRQLINDAIPDSRYRATLLSVESILDRGLNAGTAVIFGRYLQAGQLDNFLWLSATVAAVLMAVLFSLIRARQKFVARV